MDDENSNPMNYKSLHPLRCDCEPKSLMKKTIMIHIASTGKKQSSNEVVMFLHLDASKSICEEVLL